MAVKHVSSAPPGAALARQFHVPQAQMHAGPPTSNRQRGRDHLPSWHSRPVTELVSNAAIEYMIAYETAQGRTVTDTRGKGAPADVKSDGRSASILGFRCAGRWLRVEMADSDAEGKSVLAKGIHEGLVKVRAEE